MVSNRQAGSEPGASAGSPMVTYIAQSVAAGLSIAMTAISVARSLDMLRGRLIGGLTARDYVVALAVMSFLLGWFTFLALEIARQNYPRLHAYLLIAVTLFVLGALVAGLAFLRGDAAWTVALVVGSGWPSGAFMRGAVALGVARDAL